jgi:8-oxo-dGTP diphosphatase
MANTSENRRYPKVGVGAVVFKGDKLLLIKRGQPPKPGEWSLPGGKQELGETLKEAAAREVKEETGLTVNIGALIDAVDFIDRQDGAVAFHYSLIDYIAEFVAGEISPASDAIDAHFFSLEEALSLPLWTETKRIIQMAVEMRRIRPTAGRE